MHASRTPAAARDDTWFAAMFRANFTDVLRYVARRHPQADAHDVVAEAFLVAWRRRATAPSDDELRPWLYGVARNVLRNEERSRTRRQRLRSRLASLPMHVEPDVASAVDTSIGRALATLPDADQEILRLVAFEGLDRRGLSVALDCSTNAAGLRLHRARARLRRVMERTEQSGAASRATGGNGQADTTRRGSRVTGEDDVR